MTEELEGRIQIMCIYVSAASPSAALSWHGHQALIPGNSCNGVPDV